jgi:hypothetical protein
MKKLLIIGALGLAAVLGAPAGAVAAETTTPLPKPSEPVTAPTFQSPKLGLVLYVDIVQSGKSAEKPAEVLAGCAQTSIIHVGQTIVFRMWGVDAANGGVPLAESNVEQAYVKIPGVLVNGVATTVRFSLGWGQHLQGKASTAQEAIKHAYWTLGVPTKGEVKEEKGVKNLLAQSESPTGALNLLPATTKIEIPLTAAGSSLAFTVHVVTKPTTVTKVVKKKVTKKVKGKKKVVIKKITKKVVVPGVTGEFSQANFPISSQLVIVK